MSNTTDTYAKVFDAIITEMEQGRAPWVKPWTATGAGGSAPYNAITGRPYSGGNVFALWLAGMAYALPAWLTFKQALAADCVVRKGEKGTTIFYMSTSTARTPDDDTDTRRPSKFFFAKAFTVFNIDQLDELKTGALDALRAKCNAPAPMSLFERLENAEQMVAATGATIRHGGAIAAYIPTVDGVVMPAPESFTGRDAYYSTLFHELTHWTGHASRLDRLTPAKFGAPEYAFEELVAELGAAFLSASFGFDTVTQSAAYLRTWAKACRQSPDMFARAASLASKAAEYLTTGGAAALEDADTLAIAA